LERRTKEFTDIFDDKKNGKVTSRGTVGEQLLGRRISGKFYLEAEAPQARVSNFRNFIRDDHFPAVNGGF